MNTVVARRRKIYHTPRRYNNTPQSQQKIYLKPQYGKPVVRKITPKRVITTPNSAYRNRNQKKPIRSPIQIKQKNFIPRPTPGRVRPLYGAPRPIKNTTPRRPRTPRYNQRENYTPVKYRPLTPKNRVNYQRRRRRNVPNIPMKIERKRERSSSFRHFDREESFGDPRFGLREISFQKKERRYGDLEGEKWINPKTENLRSDLPLKLNLKQPKKREEERSESSYSELVTESFVKDSSYYSSENQRTMRSERHSHNCHCTCKQKEKRPSKIEKNHQRERSIKSRVQTDGSINYRNYENEKKEEKEKSVERKPQYKYNKRLEESLIVDKPNWRGKWRKRPKFDLFDSSIGPEEKEDFRESIRESMKGGKDSEFAILTKHRKMQNIKQKRNEGKENDVNQENIKHARKSRRRRSSKKKSSKKRMSHEKNNLNRRKSSHEKNNMRKNSQEKHNLNRKRSQEKKSSNRRRRKSSQARNKSFQRNLSPARELKTVIQAHQSPKKSPKKSKNYCTNAILNSFGEIRDNPSIVETKEEFFRFKNSIKRKV